MDRGVFLPFKRNVGVQLGPGIRNSALYLASTKKSPEADSKWICAAANGDDAQAKDFVLEVAEKQTFLDIESGINSVSEAISGDELVNSTSDSEQDSIGSPVESSNSLKLFKSVRMLTDHGYEARVDSPIAPLAFCPRQVLDVPEGLNVDNALQAVANKHSADRKTATNKDGMHHGVQLLPQIMDPNDMSSFIVGSAHTTNDLRINNDPHQIIAYASGETRSMINISLVKPTNTSVPLTLVDSASSYNLHSKIKNIVIPDFSSTLNRSSDVIAVLTTVSLYVFKIRSIERSTGAMSIEKLGPYPFSVLEDFAFVDIAFNPWDFNEFAVVDAKGNWVIGNVVKKGSRNSRLRFSTNKRGSIYDPEELSSWHKIAWGADYSCLLLVSRSRLVELNLRSKLQLEVVQAKSWSSIRDFNRVNDQIAVLTTSKEIILMKLRNENIERVISWKHSLNPNDTSIRSTVRAVAGEEWLCHQDKLFFAFVYSSLRTEVLVHVFAQSGLLWQSLGSSLLNLQGIKDGLSCLVVPQVSLNYDHEDSRRPELKCLVREVGGSVIWQVAVSAAEREPVASASHEKVIDLSDWSGSEVTPIAKISSEVTKLDLSLPSLNDHNNAATEEAHFQQYGYDLSDGMNQYLMKWAQEMENPEEVKGIDCYSLASLAEEISSVGNMEEFGSLLEQFKGHYREHEVNFTALQTLAKLIIEDDVSDLGVFYLKLLQCWSFGFPDDGIVTSEVLKSIVLKNTGISSVSLLPVVAATAYSQLNGFHREVVDSWDETFDELESKAPLSDANTGVPLESDMSFPLVKPSQQSPPKLKRSKNRISSQASQQPKSQSMILDPRTNVSHAHPTHIAEVSSVLPLTMTPAFSLSSASQPVPTLSDSQARNSQKQKRKKKRLQGFG
ncbi:LAFA_0D11034g1_1 [Lachancea sp. 'fantastica']|nr:LAFA_0D11034g1_1 [Lachancea sp. 'fantastica']